jgi:transposase
VEKASSKQIIGLYHDRVAHRVSEGNHLLALGKRWGVMLERSRLLRADGESHLKGILQGAVVPQEIVLLAEELRQGLMRAIEQEESLHRQVVGIVRGNPAMSRTAELAGYGPIRAATLISHLDTPWRFKSKSALWKYVGIGLRRERSGEGMAIIKVEQSCNRLLRWVVIGAARTAIQQKQNVFARRYARWIQAGTSPRNARRNVARDQVTALWGMWKSGRAFDEKLMGD